MAKVNKPYHFEPNGNDLKKVFFYYSLDLEEKMICPFHEDSNPSCHVNFEEGVFHCFACGASGDAFQFVNLANPKLDDLSSLILYNVILKSDKVKKLKLSKDRSAKAKTQKENNRSYDQEIAYDYYFGLSTVDWAKNKKSSLAYKKYLIKRGFYETVLNDCGAKLTITDDNYPLIFPMLDMGEFKGYVCRTTDKEIEKKRKYLYNKGFSRQDTLVGTYDSEVVVVCEGYMDWLKLKQYGVKNAVAILGWKATSIQIDKLRARGVKTIISALDTDSPGVKGTDYLKNFFDVIRFQFPEDAKDPGDLNKKQFDLAYKKTRALYKKKRRS